MDADDAVLTHDLGRRLDAALDLAGMVAACRRVVQIPSLSFEEHEVARVVADDLRRLGFDQVDIDGNGNVVGRMPGAGGGPSLMVNGHLDHVPPGDMSDPYSGALVDAGRWSESGQAIYGRGSCDMKCNVMASAYAIAAIRRAGLRLRGDVVFVADIGEEVDSPRGVKSVIERGVTADYGLSTESTDGRVYIGHRGKIDVELLVHGRTAHASEPARGVNAIEQAQPLLQALRTYALSLPDDDLLGPATAAVTAIRSSPDNGTAVIPDRCVVRVDRRYVRGESADTCEAELRRLLAEVAASSADFHCDFSLITHYPLMYVDPGSAVVRAALAARADATGEAGQVGAWRFGVNGTFMCAAGIPTVGLGPGHEKWAHTPDEHVLISDLKRESRTWMRMIVTLCGVAQT